MTEPLASRAFADLFLGRAPRWYKRAIVASLVLNPIALALAGPFVAGWLLVVEFIFTLAMALRCYPLQPGGLLAIEAIALGMASPAAVYDEVQHNTSVILLLVFMVAGIHFLKDLLLFAFTKVLLGVRSKVTLSLVFCLASAILSAFLDALTVVAAIVFIATGFHAVYRRSIAMVGDERSDTDDAGLPPEDAEALEGFRAFLRTLVMHAAVGTALGGTLTLVGEPQNLIIGEAAGWHFGAFFLRMAPVTLPVFAAGIAVCFVLERAGLFGYGAKLPPRVARILLAHAGRAEAGRTPADRARLVVQAVVASLLVIGLSLHLAEVGLLGLAVLVVGTAFTGVTEEHALGEAFEEALPFTALVTVFFAVVAVIHAQHLFAPIVERVLALSGPGQVGGIYLATAALSIVSDNVFVASVYLSATRAALDAGTIARAQFEALAVAINAGTNIPSVATPNGQAAFLFLLTSALAPRIRLSYGAMVRLALPYAVVMTIVGLLGVLRLR